MTEHSTLTNETPHSTYEITGMLMPARAFFFIVVDEPGKDGFLLGKYMLQILIPIFQKWTYQKQKCFQKLILNGMV